VFVFTSFRNCSHVRPQSDVRKVGPDHVWLFEGLLGVKVEEVVEEDFADVFIRVVRHYSAWLVVRSVANLFNQRLDLVCA
jgi:hypothetical protein